MRNAVILIGHFDTVTTCDKTGYAFCKQSRICDTVVHLILRPLLFFLIRSNFLYETKIK